ncbi:MAG: hypothetical protein KA181_07735, partial [Xylophilus sp.]|nr:hypothetical protein [Xylophilus sp.]
IRCATKLEDLNTPRLRGLRSAFANPLAGGDAGGLAKPDPRRLLDLPCFAAQNSGVNCYLFGSY